MLRIRLAALMLAGPWLGWMAGGALPAAAAATAPDNPNIYPSTERIRQTQLAVYSCSRENTPAACDKARSLANPLMDHPMLSSYCKDAVWDVLQKAKPDPGNSFERRDALDAAGSELMGRCREVKRTATTPKKN